MKQTNRGKSDLPQDGFFKVPSWPIKQTVLEAIWDGPKLWIEGIYIYIIFKRYLPNYNSKMEIIKVSNNKTAIIEFTIWMGISF